MAFATRLLQLIAPHAARALALAGRAGPRGIEAGPEASVKAIQAAVALQLEAARRAAYEAAEDKPETEMAAEALKNVTFAAAKLMGGLVKAQLARLLLYTASNRQLRSAPGGTVIDRPNTGQQYSHVPADSYIRQVGPADTGLAVAAAFSRTPKHWVRRVDDAGRRSLMPPSREQAEPQLDPTVDGIPGDPEKDVPPETPNDMMAVPLLLRGGALLGVLSLANHREAYNEGQRKKNKALDREVSISERKKKVVATAPGNEELGLLERPGENDQSERATSGPHRGTFVPSAKGWNNARWLEAGWHDWLEAAQSATEGASRARELNQGDDC